MKRTRTKQKKRLSVDAILTSDWHLREDTPTCRTDDFPEAQWNKVRQVRELQEKYDCPVLHAGDLFHHWKPSPALLTQCIRELPDQFYTVYGNHDLPQHSMDLAYKSGITTLAESGKIKVLDKGHWDQEPDVDNCFIFYRQEDKIQKTGFNKRKAHIWHKMVWTKKPPYPGAEKELEGHVLLKKYPQFDLILTGDNHQQFVCEYKGRLLVNPGCLSRQTAAFADFRPAVWLYNAEKNKVKPHYLDIAQDVVSRVHIEKKAERDERISAFVERLDTDWEAGLDFEENLKRFGEENEIPKPVMEICYKAMEV